MKFLQADFKNLILQNWKSGLTVALISVPLSIALSVASGAGPIPGVITGIWATLIAAIFGSNNYNVIGAAYHGTFCRNIDGSWRSWTCGAADDRHRIWTYDPRSMGDQG
jgi:hypothetical protein